MWFVGYEKCTGRECWRFPFAERNSAGNCYNTGTKWPSEKFRESNLKLIDFLNTIVLTALTATVGPLPGNSCVVPSDHNDDLSTSFAFHYPNTSGWQPQQPGILIKEHVDASLFVATFVPQVHGLEVFDLKFNQWIAVEDVCKCDEDIVVFAGEYIELLEELHHRKIKACKHRVSENPGHARTSFLFEQRYKPYIAKAKELFRKKELTIKSTAKTPKLKNVFLYYTLNLSEIQSI